MIVVVGTRGSKELGGWVVGLRFPDSRKVVFMKVMSVLEMKKRI